MKAKKRNAVKQAVREVRRRRLWDDLPALTRTLVLMTLGVHVAAKLGGQAGWGLLGAGIGLAVGLVKRELLNGPVIWGVLAIVLGWLAFGRAEAANHTYLMCYVALAMALCSGLVEPAEQGRAVAFNARLLLVCVMAFAVAQKAVSTDFRDGSYLSYLMLTGRVGDLAWRSGLAPETRAAQLRNQQRELEFKPTSKTFATESVEFENPFGHALPAIVVLLAATILASETLLAVAFAWKPNAWVTHALLLAFAAMLVVIRPEAMFMATLLSLGALVAQASSNERLVRIYFVVAMIAIGMAIAGLPGNLNEV